MAGIVSVKVTGLSELEKRISEMPPRAAKAIVRRALKKAGAIFQGDMEQHAPKDTGFLALHIGMKTRVSGKELAGTASVGPLREDYPHKAPTSFIGRARTRQGPGRPPTAALVARFLEFGTQHMAPRPFIRRAFDGRSGEALEAFTDEAREALNDEASR
jgi:HK97 gp10 family phage protein